MASETNELTFVRCPTCRSLVPASAARCRICNAALEAGGSKPAATDSPNQTGRVRQKTVSATPEEVQTIVAGASIPATPPQPTGPASAPPAPAAEARPTNDDDAFDPLGAFLQDLDSDESAPPAPVEPLDEEPVAPARASAPAPTESGKEVFFDDEDDDDEEDDDDLDDFDLDIFDDPSFDELQDKGDPLGLIEPLDEDDPPLVMREESPAAPRAVRSEEQPAPPPPQKPRAPAPQSPARKPETPRPQGSPGQSARVAESAKPAPPPQPPKQQPHERQAPPPMRPKMGGQPMQAAPKQSRPQEQANRPKPPPAQQPQQNRQPERREQMRPKDNEPRRTREDNLGGYSDSMRNARDAHRPTGGVRGEAPPIAESQQAETTAVAGPRMGKIKPGRLFGWLVSYENADGRAIELRAGRFFVTGTTIRGSDLILEDQSISTPHALMSINERGLLLQDLMSERGTFVRSPGEAQYRREEGIIEVQHGDWIRFGDVEFLVTIVPG
jgi:hypothetical protein